MIWKDYQNKYKELTRSLKRMGFEVQEGKPKRGPWQARMPFKLRGSVAKLRNSKTLMDLANDIGVLSTDISLTSIPSSSGTVTNFDILLDTEDRTPIELNTRPVEMPHTLPEFYETKKVIPPRSSRVKNPMAFWVGLGF